MYIIDDLDLFLHLLYLGLNLLDILTTFADTEDEGLQVQIEVFHESNTEDDDALTEAQPGGIDLNNHQQVFNAVFQKVGGSTAGCELDSVMV